MSVRTGTCGLSLSLDGVGDLVEGLAAGARGLLERAREGRVVEDLGDGVAHLLHDEARAAGRLVGALLAARVSALAHARDRCERAVDDADDVAEYDLGRALREDVAASLALLAVEHARVLELEQNRLEELPWDVLALGEIGDEHRPAPLVAGQGVEGAERIATFAGQTRHSRCDS